MAGTARVVRTGIRISQVGRWFFSLNVFPGLDPGGQSQHGAGSTSWPEGHVVMRQAATRVEGQRQRGLTSLRQVPRDIRRQMECPNMDLRRPILRRPQNALSLRPFPDRFGR